MLRINTPAPYLDMNNRLAFMFINGFTYDLYSTLY